MRHADQPSDQWLRAHRKVKWAGEELRKREQRQRSSGSNSEQKPSEPVSLEQAKARTQIAEASVQ
jgi:hypothetical protein